MYWFFSLLIKVPPLILELSIWIWMLLLLRSYIIISFLFILWLSRVTSMIFFKMPFFVLMSRLLLILVNLLSSLFILILVFVLYLSFRYPSFFRLCITTSTSSRYETSTSKKSSTSATSATSIASTITSSVKFFWRGGWLFSLSTWLLAFLWNVVLILVFELISVFNNLSLFELRHMKIW